MSPFGHLRRGHVDGMSAIAPIATELLREGNGRKGPQRDERHCSNLYAFARGYLALRTGKAEI